MQQPETNNDRNNNDGDDEDDEEIIMMPAKQCLEHSLTIPFRETFYEEIFSLENFLLI